MGGLKYEPSFFVLKEKGLAMEQGKGITTGKKNMLTPQEVAAELSISLPTVYNLLARGQLRAVNLSAKNSRRLYRVPRAALVEFLDRRTVPGPVEVPCARHAKVTLPIRNFLRL